MEVTTEARYGDARSPAQLLDYAQADHYIAVARQMRAQALADMVRKSYRALTRMARVAPVAGHGKAHTA